ncbi:uncharacterized protein [Ptychodera flava]|uniref:uncharacterized protein n=1 Tax=Ptychodera flava TaxID=63121 RepID=UPI00396A1809
MMKQRGMAVFPLELIIILTCVQDLHSLTVDICAVDGASVLLSLGSSALILPPDNGEDFLDNDLDCQLTVRTSGSAAVTVHVNELSLHGNDFLRFTDDSNRTVASASQTAGDKIRFQVSSLIVGLRTDNTRRAGTFNLEVVASSLGESTSNQKWTANGRCGAQNPLSNGNPSECNPDADDHCCSSAGYCSSADSDCTCAGCVDYSAPEFCELDGSVWLASGDSLTVATPNYGSSVEQTLSYICFHQIRTVQGNSLQLSYDRCVFLDSSYLQISTHSTEVVINVTGIAEDSEMLILKSELVFMLWMPYFGTPSGECRFTITSIPPSNSSQNETFLVTPRSNMTSTIYESTDPSTPPSESTASMTDTEKVLEDLQGAISSCAEVHCTINEVIDVLENVAEVVEIQVTEQNLEDVFYAMENFVGELAAILPPGEQVTVKSNVTEISLQSIPSNTTGGLWEVEYGRRKRNHTQKKHSASLAMDIPDISKHQSYPCRQASGLIAVAIFYHRSYFMASDPDDEESKQNGDVHDIDSDVISGSMIYCGRVLTTPVTYSLEIDESSEKGEVDGKKTPVCVYLDTNHRENLQWLTTGCNLVKSQGQMTECHCIHTTNFAVMLQVVPVKLDSKHVVILSCIGYIGGVLSIISLFVGFLVYARLRSLLKSERVAIHQNLMASMLLVQLVLLFSEISPEQTWFCMMIAVSLHYFTTVMFFWMLIEGVQLFRQVVIVFGSEKSWFLLYCVLAWGVPFLIVTITASCKREDYIFKDSCWLSRDGGVIWVFAGTVIVVTTINLVILLLVIRIVYKASKISGHTADGLRSGLKSALMLLPLLGVTWLLGFFSVSNDTIAFTYIFTILNSLQGFFLFIFYIVVNSEVRSAYRRLVEIKAAETGEVTYGSSGNAKSGGKSLAKKTIRRTESEV